MKLLIAASTILLAAPALAAPAMDSVTREVRSDNLDLSTPAGRQQLDARVGRAARQLCALSERGLAAIEAEKACVALAMKHAAPQVALAVARSTNPVRLATASPAPRG